MRFAHFDALEIGGEKKKRGGKEMTGEKKFSGPTLFFFGPEQY